MSWRGFDEVAVLFLHGVGEGGRHWLSCSEISSVVQTVFAFLHGVGEGGCPGTGLSAAFS